ncbi:MAG: NADH-quinone oxidoreductase subunit C [Coriobacteriia bacterium]|nr:NADH-quinone oxidoreductase subunit C [Coriobacteriia bacterium]MCL2606907.1 NADH-quinone oxidoreductase subunit C [Coriobacteriia bacterium]
MNPATLTECIATALDTTGVTDSWDYQIDADDNLGVVMRLPAAQVMLVLDALRKDSDLQFVQLIDLFGADIRDLIEVTYRLRSLRHNVDLIIKCELPYDGDYQSVGHVFASALLPERELCEMYGLTLHGHSNPKRLLTIEGMPPFLRKSTAIRTKEEIWG